MKDYSSPFEEHNYIYDGCQDKIVPLAGQCLDSVGQPYGYVSKGSITRVSTCEEFCANLPNHEYQVGYHFGRSAELGGCYCNYEKGYLPSQGSISEAYISDTLPGTGPVRSANGNIEYMCFPRSTSLSSLAALKTCDATMNLLVGNTTSLGTLRSIVEELKNNGPDYMPGSCCLDSAADSSEFGYEVSQNKCKSHACLLLFIYKPTLVFQP